MNAQPEIVQEVVRCVRCGMDHERVGFFRFERPPGKYRSGQMEHDFQWWATCPVSAEPIILASTRPL